MPLMPINGPDGEQNALVEGITGFYKGRFMITDKAKNPEILMQWIDRFYENMETGLNATYGIGPDKEKAWYYDDNNNIIFKKDTELPEDQIRGQQQLRLHLRFLEPVWKISSGIRPRTKSMPR